MTVTETLYTADRAAWRQWLAEHHAHADEIWLVSYRKATGRPSLPYNDAVEEALCFGWIDSTRKTLDAERYAQRFTRRRAGSAYSQPNVERLRRLVAAGRVLPEVAEGVAERLAAPFVYPPDIVDALRAHPRAWDHFQCFSEAYRRIRVAYVSSARAQPAEFEKRLDHLLRMTAQGKLFGHGIETYY